MTKREERKERVRLGLDALREAVQQSLRHTNMQETQAFSLMLVALGFFLGSVCFLPFLPQVASLATCIIWACIAGCSGGIYLACKKRKQRILGTLQVLSEWAEKDKVKS